MGISPYVPLKAKAISLPQEATIRRACMCIMPMFAGFACLPESPTPLKGIRKGNSYALACKMSALGNTSAFVIREDSDEALAVLHLGGHGGQLGCAIGWPSNCDPWTFLDQASGCLQAWTGGNEISIWGLRSRAGGRGA